METSDPHWHDPLEIPMRFRRSPTDKVAQLPLPETPPRTHPTSLDSPMGTPTHLPDAMDLDDEAIDNIERPDELPDVLTQDDDMPGTNGGVGSPL